MVVVVCFAFRHMFPRLPAYTNKRSGIFVLTSSYNTCCASYSGALTRENNHENRTSICNTSAAVQLTNRQQKGRLKLKSNSCHSRYTANDRGGRGGSKSEEATNITLKRTSINWVDKRDMYGPYHKQINHLSPLMNLSTWGQQIYSVTIG